MADDDGPVELTVRLPAATARRIEALTPGARLPDVLCQAVVAMVEITEREQEEERRREAGPTSPDEGAEPGDGDARGDAPPPELAVGDAAEVLDRLDGLASTVEGSRDRVAAGEERERVTRVWIKRTLAELFVHTTPFPTTSGEAPATS